jgi:hypothetical protein
VINARIRWWAPSSRTGDSPFDLLQLGFWGPGRVARLRVHPAFSRVEHALDPVLDPPLPRLRRGADRDTLESLLGADRVLAGDPGNLRRRVS